MANRYWVGGSGAWTSTSHWSTTSGGSGGASVPTSSDDVIFNSASATGDIEVTWAGGVSVNSFTSVGFPYKLDLKYSGSTPFYLSLNVNSTIRLHNVHSSSFYNLNIDNFNINASQVQLYQTGSTDNNISIGSNASLQTDFTGRSIENQIGKFSSNGHTVTLTGGINTYTNSGIIIDISDSLVYASGISMRVSGTTVIADRSKVVLNGGYVKSFPGQNFNIIEYVGSSNYFNVDGTLSVKKLVLKAGTILASYTSGSRSYISVAGTNQILPLTLSSVKDIEFSGAGIYYSGSSATNGGNNAGVTFSNAPKVESFSDNFPGTSLNTSKWVSSTGGGASISVAGNILSVIGSDSRPYANIISKDQFLLEGSSLYFRLYKPTGGTTAGTFYLANAYRQYGVYAQRDIPDIYVNFTSTTLNFVINGHTTYSNSFTFADEQFIRFRENAGRIYLDTSPNGSTWTNRFMPLLSTYGITSTQITARPEIEYEPPSGSGSFGIAELNVAQTPTAIFTGSPVSGTRPLTVNFTNSSLRADTYSWAFGDGTTSTAENPTKTYSSPGTYTVALTVTNDLGSDTQTRTNYITASVSSFTREAGGTMVFSGTSTRKLLASRAAGGTMVYSGSTRAIIIRDAETLQDKVYLYKVYDPDGDYVETWQDVVSELAFTHEINSIGSTTTVELARNSDTVGTTTAPLQDHTGTNILTHDNQPILVTTESRNQIGSGSSVDYNNRVDIIAFYGSVEPLLTHTGEEILTHDDEPILASVGAPNGRRVFTGFISEINSRYGNSETTVVQLTSYGFDLDQFPVTTEYNNNVTTVAFNSYDPSNIVSTAIDRFAQAAALEQVSYTMRTSTSISLSGTVVSYTFRNNTYKELLDKTLELLPSNWYYRIGLGDNTVYVRERSTTPDHIFYLGKHIKALDLKGSILDITNHTLFTGGGDPALYVEHKEAPAARTRRGLQVLSDSRVTLQSSADIISEGKIDEGNKLQYRTTVEILTKQYDIESVNVGQTVGFRNFGNYVDDLVLQIVGLSYSPDVLQLQLETKPLTINRRLEDVYRNLKVTENIDTPTTPV